MPTHSASISGTEKLEVDEDLVVRPSAVRQPCTFGDRVNFRVLYCLRGSNRILIKQSERTPITYHPSSGGAVSKIEPIYIPSPQRVIGFQSWGPVSPYTLVHRLTSDVLAMMRHWLRAVYPSKKMEIDMHRSGKSVCQFAKSNHVAFLAANKPDRLRHTKLDKVLQRFVGTVYRSLLFDNHRPYCLHWRVRVVINSSNDDSIPDTTMYKSKTHVKRN